MYIFVSWGHRLVPKSTGCVLKAGSIVNVANGGTIVKYVLLYGALMFKKFNGLQSSKHKEGICLFMMNFKNTKNVNAAS